MKRIKYYLWKLNYLSGTKIKKSQLNTNDRSDDIIYNKLTGDYIKIEANTADEDLGLFLKVKNAYNLNIIRLCIVICTVFFVIAVGCLMQLL